MRITSSSEHCAVTNAIPVTRAIVVRLAICAVLLLQAHPSCPQEWVIVDDAGNAPDPATSFGSVDYDYRIGKFEVTIDEYVEFLNAVGQQVDTYGLFDPFMTTSIWAGITQNGTPGNYVYSLSEPDIGRAPVNYVDFWDTLRFANWVNNGKPSGLQDATTTEDGAYTLTPTGIAANTVSRNSDAKVFLPNDDEWYKAAYYKGGSPDAGYWLYATQSNVEPTKEFPPGGNNSANHGNALGGIISVGSYVNSPGPYGTFDQTGNLWEWNETVVFRPQTDNPLRAIRGGSFNLNGENGLLSTWQDFLTITRSSSVVGFRLASIFPPLCDFDENYECDVFDLDVLIAAFGTTTAAFDFDSDGTVNDHDRDLWLSQAGELQYGETLKSGDVNLDGVVDPADLNVLGIHWLSNDVSGWSIGDFNGDRRIDQFDLNALALHWQSDIRPLSATVPEPTSGSFSVFIAVLFALVTRKRRK